MKTLVVYDLDDTIIKTDARIYVRRKVEKEDKDFSLNTEQFTRFALEEGDVINLGEFIKPINNFIVNGREIDRLKKLLTDPSYEVYVITLRPGREYIHNLLHNIGVNLKKNNIIAMGDKTTELYIKPYICNKDMITFLSSSAQQKLKIIKGLVTGSYYYKLIVFDNMNSTLLAVKNSDLEIKKETFLIKF